MSGNPEQRRLHILHAIVADYVATREPVGSKAVVDRHSLGVSSATVRNDMAVLEAEGYITQPHSSSGRIPTAKGYRRFVDALSEVKPLSVAERRAITRFLDGAVDLDDVLRRGVQLLSRLTNQVAVVQYPVLSVSRVRHLELVRMSPDRALAVVILDTGRVDQRMVEFSRSVSAETVATIRDLLGQAMAGRKLSEAADAVAALAAGVPEQSSPEVSVALTTVVRELMYSLVEEPSERVVLGGTANLSRHRNDFTSGVSTLLEMLEEQVVVLKLLQAQQNSAERWPVTVQIHDDAPPGPASDSVRHGVIPGTAVVSTEYGDPLTPFGRLGVLGPTRMDYPGAISAVAAVAHYIGDILDGR